MPYERTGKPPGRPRNDGLPAGSKPAKAEPAKPKPETHPAAPEGPFPPAYGHEGTELAAQGELCKEHFPDGWPGSATGLGCTHRDDNDDAVFFSWTRRIA